jgi:dipeptidyl aminopeptidase/acylaminoacyl peptidase
MSNPNDFTPQHPGGFYPQPPQAKRGPSCLMIALLILGGGGALLCLICCGGITVLSRTPQASAKASQPFSLDEVPMPAFPERGEASPVAPRVIRYEVSLGESGGYYTVPGVGGKLLIYLPEGRHKPKSLACILITGAGSNLLSGMLLGEGDSPEHLPYAQASYAVVAYELDGPQDDAADPDDMRRAYDAFKASRAGLVNARNALQYVFDQLPEVDPAQIYAAGHSSAATHALLFAEHEPRLAGVIAYAPAVDVTARFGPLLRALAMQLPGVTDFAAQSSPSTHRARLKCPTFLFHAEDDTNCPIGQTRQFAEQLKQQGTDVTFLAVATGNHYDSMIDEGIPAAIRWLRERQRQK